MSAPRFDQAVHTGDVTGIGAVRLLEAIRHADPSIRFYQASSSEMFGSTPPPQNEETPFHPRSPYAVAKVYAYWATVNYRESFDIHANNGILFNHESPRRGKEFVTRKITATIPRLMKGEQKKLYLGNLDAKRDWGHARDYVRAMQMMLRHPEPLDLVIGTGQSHSVRDFLDAAFAVVDLDWEQYVEIDPKFYRPAEVDFLASRHHQGQGDDRMGARDHLRGTGEGDGRSRPQSQWRECLTTRPCEVKRPRHRRPRLHRSSRRGRSRRGRGETGLGRHRARNDSSVPARGSRSPSTSRIGTR